MFRPARSERGFTLIEVMIVVVIIGILLGIATPVFLRAREGSRAKACQHNLLQIVGAKERWAMDNHRGADDEPTHALLSPYYIRAVPICPSGGTYTPRRLRDTPICTVGGVSGAYDAHVLW